MTRRIVDVAFLVLCAAVAGAVSIAMGQDANWDLQNYHFYGPWALLHGRALDVDIAAAQLQTYLNPLLDVPFYAMVAADWDPRAISFALALPAGISAWLLAKIAWALFANPVARLQAGATIAAMAIGLTAAMAVGTLGMTMNDWPGTALMLAALWLVVRDLAAAGRIDLPRGTVVAAGLLAGIGSGLKLTVATFAVGLCVALLVRPPHTRARWREAFVFGLAVLAGLLVSYGYWAWQMWAHFGNPVFPWANTWFGSPWWEKLPVLVRDYGPHSLSAWLEFPLRLREPRPGYVTEVAYTDARIPLLYVLAVAAGIGALLARAIRASARAEPPPAPRLTAAWTVVAAFWGVSFLLWTEQYSIVRYIVLLEVLTGVLIVGLLRLMLRPGYADVAVTLAAVVLIATTRWPDWWRIEHGPQWFDVKVPAMAPRPLVLIASGAPTAYVLPFFPADARHVGVRNNINFPGRPTLMERAVADAIRTHTGSFYALQFPAGDGVADLAAHGLRPVPGGCGQVRTNMRMSPLELCRLERIEPPSSDAR